MPNAPRFPFRVADGALLEIPMTTLRFGGRNLPCAGGGYFRLLPYEVFRAGLRHFNRADNAPGIFYMHPWEIDAGQPRVEAAPRMAKFRHYLNLRKMPHRLQRLLGDFRWSRVDEVFADALEYSPGDIP
jgi:polysaccharide deacetylase family protein (PEP-CTERM system associated)